MKPRWIKSAEVSYRDGSNPPRFYTAPDQKSAEVSYRDGSNPPRYFTIPRQKLVRSSTKAVKRQITLKYKVVWYQNDRQVSSFQNQKEFFKNSKGFKSYVQKCAQYQICQGILPHGIKSIEV
jgi:hypothetical protein